MEKLLTPGEVCDLFGIRPQTLYCWTHLKKIPFQKVGKFVRFRGSDLEKWLLLQQKQTAINEKPLKRSAELSTAGRRKKRIGGSILGDEIVKRAKQEAGVI